MAQVEQSLRISIIMGSQSDWKTMKHAADTLDELGVAYETRVISAHRTPDLLYQDILAKSHGECDHEIARHIAPPNFTVDVIATQPIHNTVAQGYVMPSQPINPNKIN